MTETRAKSSLGGMSRRAVESLGDTVASLPPREATLVEFPDLQPELSEALRKMGASSLYSHQLEAYERVRAGENVVVATATASGKSLCYKIPAFQNALGRAKSRAVFLYPTKALAQDQLGKIQSFGLRGVHPATYDGDTPHALRADIRRRANILLTNPDMLNIGILPNHEAWADFLRNLEIVAVDEAHVLRGVFGSHVAAVLRRLRRVASHLSQPSLARQGERGEAESSDRSRSGLREPRLAGGQDHSFRQDAEGCRAHLPLRRRQAWRRRGAQDLPLPRWLHPKGEKRDRRPSLPRRPPRRRLHERAGARGRRRDAGCRGLLRIPRQRRLHLAAVGTRRTWQGPRPRRVHRRPRLARPVPLREPAEGSRQESGGGQGYDGESLHPRPAPARRC